MLSRERITSGYGDFKRMMEAREEHGGFGDVTWNIGPHAGPNPYGKNYRVLFVDRNKLLAGHKSPHPDHEVAQHVQTIGKQMDNGTVIHVPHVQFKGGAPVFDAKHLASVHAAGQRGAEKVPVVVHNDDHLQLMMRAGGQVPDAPRPGQDKSVKWRWNGKQWYTKPSFNQGKCPGGTGADLAKDKCIGGGTAPPAGKQRDATPAALYGSQSLPPGRHRSGEDPSLRPGRGGGQAPAENVPAAPAAPTPPPSSRRGKRTSAGPLPQPIARAEVSPHTAGQGGIGLDQRIFGAPDYIIHQSMQQASQEAAQRLQTIAPHLQIGESYGCGLSGCAFAGPEEPDGTPTVIKMDKGENEATMARLVLKHKDLGSIRSIPRYIEVVNTGVRDGVTGMRVNAIHREDLRNFKSNEGNIKSFFGSYGSFIGEISRDAKKKSRASLLREFDQRAESYRQLASRDPSIAKHFDQVHQGTRKLIERGIVPCDLHSGNWGIRDKTGEVVMRDVGCSHFAKDLA